MSQQTLVSEILAKQWRKKKRSRPNYSLRALARDLQMDPSFISRIFKGQKPLPTERVEDFVQMLDMDPLSTVGSLTLSGVTQNVLLFKGQ